MDLYMIRHGESLANFTGTHAGWAPVPLTEKGEAQAEAARRHVRNLTFDRLYVSDVRRRRRTFCSPAFRARSTPSSAKSTTPRCAERPATT